MPHPIEEISFNSTPGAIFDRPRLAAWIGVICAQWTVVEQSMVSILSAMLEGNTGAAMAVFASLESEHARLVLIRAIAESRLNAVRLGEYTELAAEYKKRRKERNTVVHGQWGVSAAHFDALVRVDPRQLVRLHAVMGSPPGAADRTLKIQKHWPTVDLWKERDFEAVAARIGALNDKLFNFNRAVWEDTLATRQQAAAQPSRPPNPQ